MNRFVFINAKIFTLDPDNTYYNNGFLMVCGENIGKIGDMKDFELPDNDTEIIDVKEAVLMPGMISCHSHFYGQFIRGMQSLSPTVNWQQILSHVWWKFDRQLTERDIYFSTLMGLIEGIKSGTTTYIDHHSSPGACPGSLDVIQRAVEKSGARACLAYEVTDRNGETATKEGIDENVRFIKKVKSQNAGRISALFGLHASYSLSDKTLEKCASLGKELNAGFHIHVAEDMADVNDSYRRCDNHVVGRLNSFGILGEKTLAAHCVHIGPEQWDIFRKTGTTASYNCQSNTNNAVGISPVYQMLKSGVNVALGGDGYTYDLFHELSIGVILQRLANKNPGAMSGKQTTDLAFNNCFKFAGKFYKRIGALISGGLADFIIVNYNSPTPLNRNNFLSHLMSGFSGNVDTVVVAGNIIMRHKVLQYLDEESILASCRQQAANFWSRMV